MLFAACNTALSPAIGSASACGHARSMAMIAVLVLAKPAAVLWTRRTFRRSRDVTMHRPLRSFA